MSNKIPKGIERIHVERAIRDWESGEHAGFHQSVKYDLEFNGKFYPPKAILGIAAAHVLGGHLKPSDFSGGSDSKCHRVLTKLGFNIVRKPGKRHYAWLRDELILTLDFYFQNQISQLSPQHPKIVELSELIRELPLHPDRFSDLNFRTPESVYLKLIDFRSFDPEFTGKNPSQGSANDHALWDEYYENRTALNALATKIVAAFENGEGIGETWEEEEESRPEGAILYRVHRSRERNQGLVAKKKANASVLACEVCGLVFSERYGQLGNGFIECHHNKHLSTYDEDDVTSLKDLRLVCSNCHRMLHRDPNCQTVEDLRNLLDDIGPGPKAVLSVDL